MILKIKIENNQGYCDFESYQEQFLALDRKKLQQTFRASTNLTHSNHISKNGFPHILHSFAPERISWAF